MHEELIKNIRSIKQRLGIGVITTLNGTDHHLMSQLDRMEDLVNKNFGLVDIVGKSEQLNYGFEKLDIVEWKGVRLKIIYIHEDTQQASIETLPDNKNYNIYKVSLKQLTKVI